MQLIRNLNFENPIIKLTYSSVFAVQLAKFTSILDYFKGFWNEPGKSIDVCIYKPFLGFHSQGMRNIEAERILIRLWGKSPLMLVHELTHCYFPSKNKYLHEGLADYFQFIHRDSSKKRQSLEFTRQLMLLYDLNTPDAMSKIWAEPQNCDNTRNNLMAITRFLNMFLVDYLMDTVGIDEYFRLHAGDSSSVSMETVLNAFFMKLYKPTVTVPKSLEKLKESHESVSRLWSEFDVFDLPASGNPMKFLKSVGLSNAQNEKAMQIYKQELQLYHSWLRAGHVK